MRLSGLISRSPPYGPDVGTVLILLNLDLILLLLLGVVIARRLVKLVLQLRQGSAGSRLHTRLVLLFSAAFGAAALWLAGASREGKESTLHLVARRFFTYTPYVAFTLGFFTVHFGGFHFVHSLFLNSFFPLVEGTPFGESIGGTFAFGLGILREAVVRFWPFIVLSGWSRIGEMKKALQPGRGPNMFLPYASVVKMHLLIFVFAGLNAAGLEYWALYPVLLLYFFPAGSVLKALFGRKGGTRAGALRNN